VKAGAASPAERCGVVVMAAPYDDRAGCGCDP